jgi:hypothetical protein
LNSKIVINKVAHWMRLWMRVGIFVSRLRITDLVNKIKMYKIKFSTKKLVQLKKLHLRSHKKGMRAKSKTNIF